MLSNISVYFQPGIIFLGQVFELILFVNLYYLDDKSKISVFASNNAEFLGSNL